MDNVIRNSRFLKHKMKKVHFIPMKLIYFNFQVFQNKLSSQRQAEDRLQNKL